MRLPRDLSGVQLAQLLTAFGYQIDRQTGSHIRLTTHQGGEHHITIPSHKDLRIGTLNGIISDVADHLKIDRKELMENLFGRKNKCSW